MVSQERDVVRLLKVISSLYHRFSWVLLITCVGMYREVPGVRIPGGSEDVMLDLAVRQLVKNYQNKTKMLERPKGASKL